MIRLPERSWKSGRISSSSLLFNVILVSSRSLFCLSSSHRDFLESVAQWEEMEPLE